MWPYHSNIEHGKICDVKNDNRACEAYDDCNLQNFKPTTAVWSLRFLGQVFTQKLFKFKTYTKPALVTSALFILQHFVMTFFKFTLSILFDCYDAANQILRIVQYILSITQMMYWWCASGVCIITRNERKNVWF